MIVQALKITQDIWKKVNAFWIQEKQVILEREWADIFEYERARVLWYEEQDKIRSVMYVLPDCDTSHEIRIYTAPKYRQRGYAKQLLETHIQQNKVECYAVVHDPAGVQAFKHLGFETIREDYLMCAKPLTQEIPSDTIDISNAKPFSLIPCGDLSFYRNIFLGCFSKPNQPEEETLAELDEEAFAQGEAYLICENHMSHMYTGQSIRSGIRKEVIGCIILSPQLDSTFLSGFGILPSKRRKRKASEVLQMLLCSPDDFPSISLHVSSDNMPAKMLYDKNGFVTTEVFQLLVRPQ